VQQSISELIRDDCAVFVDVRAEGKHSKNAFEAHRGLHRLKHPQQHPALSADAFKLQIFTIVALTCSCASEPLLSAR